MDTCSYDISTIMKCHADFFFIHRHKIHVQFSDDSFLTFRVIILLVEAYVLFYCSFVLSVRSHTIVSV